MARKQGLKTFKAEEALKALTVDFFNEKACRDYVLRRLHPDGPQCPGCGRRVNNEISINNFWELRRCECKHCGKWFTATTGTVLHNSSFDVRQIYAIASFLSLGLSDAAVAKALKISIGAVRLWRMRLSLTEQGGVSCPGN